MTWEKTRETYEDNEGIHSKQATRWGVEGAYYLTRSGKEYQIQNSNQVNALKEISTRIDEIDEKLGKNPPDNIKILLTNYRQYLIELDSDFFNLAKSGYNIGSPSQVIPTLTTLYMSNYNMINQLVNQMQELYKRVETNNKTPVDEAEEERRQEADRIQQEEEKRRQQEEEKRRQQEEEEERRQQYPPQQELDLSEVPRACLTPFSTIYNEYKAQKKKLISLIYENKSLKLVETILKATIKRLDGVRLISIRGDAGASGCAPFEDWYIKNKSWFMKEFEEIKGLLSKYNEDKRAVDKAVLPLDNGKAFTFSGGKFRRTKKNIKKIKKNKKQSKTKLFIKNQ
jgi:hypothetical protein